MLSINVNAVIVVMLEKGFCDMRYDLISKVNINELWLDEFVYPTTGKRVIRFEDYDENEGMCIVVKEISVETFRTWLKTFYEMNPRKAKKNAKGMVEIA